MKKLYISILLISAFMFSIVYFNKPIYANNYFQIHRNDKYYFDESCCGVYLSENKNGECGKTRFNKNEKDTIINFIKSLEFVEEFKREEQHPGTPPCLFINSKNYKLCFEIWSQKAIVCIVTSENEERKWYEFKTTNQQIDSILSLLDHDIF